MIDLERRLRRGLVPPLPGVAAQVRMAPRPRPGWDLATIPAGLDDAAVLLLAYPLDETPHIVLTVRGAGLRHHTGQIALPGGRVDAGESIEAAAIREAAEEIGVHPQAVRVLGRLTPVHVPISGYLLHPVVGLATRRPEFRANSGEVDRIIEVSLEALRDPRIIQSHVVRREYGGGPVDIEVPYFAVDGERVWGATAMVLSECLAVLERGETADLP